ncbi:MAG: OmpA family protein [Paludibacteraceae bacterium]|nr:OmpA family protein [Paludibacteraceae bacterium]
MKNVLRNLLIVSLMLSLCCAPVVVVAMPAPVPATQTDKQKAAAQKKKEAEKRKKEAEKAKAAREKQKAAEAKKREANKKKAAAAKANEQKKAEAEKQRAKAAKAQEEKREEAAKVAAKKQAERDKAAAERAKKAAEREEAKAKKEAEIKAKEEKAIRDYEKYQENLANPKTEVVSYFNLGFRAGYAAMMDKIQPTADGTLWGSGTLNQSNALQQLKGGPGAGLDVTYNLEYGHFLFETGLDFRYLNSTSAYGFQATRQDMTYGATYSYLFDNLRETRNLMQIGIPIMFGAQFSRYYFLLGAKVGYSLWGNYSQKGKYDITVNDPALLEPYGMGIHALNGQTNRAIKFAQPEVSLAAEVGIDLDEWLQKQPDPKKKKNKTKPGQRLPFGREHVHYRVGLFAEYGVLNTNATPAAQPVEFAPADVNVQKSNTLLAMNGNTKLNNLFVGAKFTIQFEVPGKKARPVPPPSSYAIYSVVNAETNEPLKVAFVETRGTESGKIAMREKQIGPKGFKQKHAVGSFTAKVKADGYYETEQVFQIEKVGSTSYVTIALTPCPVFRVRVYNKETGMAVPATVQIRQRQATEDAYTLQTDSTTGTARQMLAEGPQYTLHIAQLGYDSIDMPIASIGDSLNIALTPVKKGEVFVVKNLFFATNKTRILRSSEETLNNLYMYLARNPKVNIKIIGHTDSVGKDAANQKLSDGRANAVMKELIERGIAPERLQAEGRGETQPIDTNDTEEGRQNNRRVEIEIL